ncbi:hypothetical protein [Gymnodinialimonas ulvae]|uniref:hypothetical protein n=1 Tax=Gymnodinialimonas ulvae TaxID=3126504 RepID=UPI0030B2710F
MTESRSAAEIYQAFLDAVGETIAQRDFAGYSRYYLFPNRLITVQKTLLIETEADLERLFRSMCHTLELKTVAAPSRACSSAEFAEDGRTIHGAHTTWLVNATEEIRQSYKARSTLRLCDDGAWRLSASQYEDSGGILPNQVVSMTDDIPGQKPDDD